jgi:hypothetical protein
MHKHLLGNGEVVECARGRSALFYCCLLPVTVLNVLAVTVAAMCATVTVLNVHRCTRVPCVGSEGVACTRLQCGASNRVQCTQKAVTVLNVHRRTGM